MDMRYVRYLAPDERYYKQPMKKMKESEFILRGMPEEWDIKVDSYGHWAYCFKKASVLPVQGWKVHITTTMENAQKTLDIVSEYLFGIQVNFKYVSNKWELYLKNSKYGDRSASGKFITVYPIDDSQFEKVVKDLAELLYDVPNGPYILSDKRWRDSNVFFRYGGFAQMFMPDSSGKKLAIKDPKGNYIEDKREPIYTKPDFVKEPEFITQMDNENQELENETNEFDAYSVEAALHFSNGGGVYLATMQGTGEEVVLKEGRPGAGLDGYGNDGVMRVKHEGKILEQLKDVDSVVKYFKVFPVWEHMFLAEEYITSTPLHSWIAAYYPFSPEESAEKYADKAYKIIVNLRHAVHEIHSKKIGMGDLQPMNVMVDDQCSVKLIDFETADDLEVEKRPGLETPGFVSPLAKNRKQADLYALLRIARYIFLPIGPVQDLSEDIQEKHDAWIEQVYGKKCVTLIREIEDECRCCFPEAFKKQRKFNRNYSLPNIPEMITKLRTGILGDLSPDKDQLIGGDIRQYEVKGGLFNILTGGYGIAMALHRTGEVPENVLEWMRRHNDISEYDFLDNGLYTGRAGIAGVLCELGMRKEALEWYEAIKWENMDDVSIFSGLAGIGLAYLGAYICISGEEKFLENAINIAEKIKVLAEKNIELKAYDMDFIPYGFFDGWSGAAYYLQCLYEITKAEKWIKEAYNLLCKDMELCFFSEEKQVYQLKDNSRFVPYFAGGSAGIGLVMAKMQKLDPTIDWSKEIKGIANGTISKCFYSGGLFRGLSGLLACANALEKSNLLHNGNEYVDKCFRTLNLYLIEKEGRLYFPGDYSYRISADIFSGSAGILCVLQDLIDGTYCSWLPVPFYRQLKMSE